jgi:hypothetical protein
VILGVGESMEVSSITGLIVNLGASAAAVFVCWFLVTKFLERQKEQQTCVMDCQANLLALAKEKGEVLRENALAMRQNAQATEELGGLIQQMVNVLEDIKHDVPPGQLVAANTAAIDKLVTSTESLVSGLRFAAEHLPPSAVVVPAAAIELEPKGKR